MVGGEALAVKKYTQTKQQKNQIKNQQKGLVSHAATMTAATNASQAFVLKSLTSGCHVTQTADSGCMSECLCLGLHIKFQF